MFRFRPILRGVRLRPGTLCILFSPRLCLLSRGNFALRPGHGFIVAPAFPAMALSPGTHIGGPICSTSRTTQPPEFAGNMLLNCDTPGVHYKTAIAATGSTHRRRVRRKTTDR